jgi:hypothetical protein
MSYIEESQYTDTDSTDVNSVTSDTPDLDALDIEFPNCPFVLETVKVPIHYLPNNFFVFLNKRGYRYARVTSDWYNQKPSSVFWKDLTLLDYCCYRFNTITNPEPGLYHVIFITDSIKHIFTSVINRIEYEDYISELE